MTQDELNLVLDALKFCHGGEPCGTAEAIAVVEKALAQPEQPKVRTGDCLLVGVCASEGHKIQPQRPWVGLTDEEIEQLHTAWVLGGGFRQLCNAIEAKLKEKNCAG